MTITYPLDMPASLKAASLVLTLDHAVGASESEFTFEDQVQDWTGRRWLLEYRPPPGYRENVMAWVAFALRLKGRYGTFLAGDPAGATPRGAGGGSPKVDGASQSGDSLAIKDATPNITGWLLAGDWLQIGTGASSRLHMMTADANTDANGDAVLEVAPEIRPNIADGTAITITNARGVFRMLDNRPSWSIDADKFYRFGFSAAEVV
jgi:hypothetical protein